MRNHLVLATTLVGIGSVFLNAQALPDLTVSAIDLALVTTNSQTLQILGVLRATIANVGVVPTAPRFRVLAFEDTNRNGSYDAGVDRIGQEQIVEFGQRTERIPKALASLSASVGGEHSTFSLRAGNP